MWIAERAARKLIQQVRRERSQLTLYLGFAVRLRAAFWKDGEELRLEPILLYPIEDEEHGALLPSSALPHFNLDVLKSLPSADSGNIIDEAVHLSEELGLANSEEELPPWDELILRLQRARPEWAWREDLNPYAPAISPPLAELREQGIYNRAILFAGTRSPFTYGLETELRELERVDETRVQGTALGAWLRAATQDESPSQSVQDRPILEVLPLNTEQREAVTQGLAAPLTVVTGPPGTGKSQVVTSLLVNMAWQSASVLFSSKNNHAVDVVESRVNGLAPSPLLLRLGKEEHQSRIAQQLSAELAESAPPEDVAMCQSLAAAHEADRARYEAIQSEIAAVVSLRNAADELERAIEPSREMFGARFKEVGAMDTAAAAATLGAFSAALDAVASPGGSGVARLLRDSSKARMERAAAEAERLRPFAELLGVVTPENPPAELTLAAWQEFRGTFTARLEWAVRAGNYFHALKRLRDARPIEFLAQELSRVAEESARASLELWNRWLRVRPARWNPAQRKTLSEFVALLQMVTGQAREEAGRLVSGSGESSAVLGRNFAFGARAAASRACNFRPGGDR